MNLVYNVATQSEISLMNLLESLYKILQERALTLHPSALFRRRKERGYSPFIRFN